MPTLHTLQKELTQHINMTPAELRAWLRTDIAPITVANYKDSLSLEKSKKLLRLLTKPLHDLSESERTFMRNVIIRIKYLKRSRYKSTQLKDDWENSLRNLGHDIKKTKSRSYSKYFSQPL